MLRITTTTTLREPPRALSTEQGDPRWHVHALVIGPLLDIRLDGELLSLADVCTYDVDAGLVIRARRDQDGSIRIDQARERVATYPTLGRVEAKWRSDAIEKLVRQHDLEAAIGCWTDVTTIVEE